MVSKSTSILMAIGIVAVAAVAIIGLGYAYTASTDNTGNTSVNKYITLDLGDAAAYTGTFDDAIQYDTVNSADVVTYTIANKSAMWTSGTPGVCLGTATVTVARSAGNTDSYTLSVTNSAGTMTGTFYIGIKVGDAAEIVREYTPGATNYYNNTVEGHGAATASGTTITGSETTIIVKMYMSALGNATTAPDTTKPLDNVTFRFTATAVSAA